MGRFAPLARVATAGPAWAETYRAELRRAFADYCDRHRPRLELFGFDDLLLVWDTSQR